MKLIGVYIWTCCWCLPAFSQIDTLLFLKPFTVEDEQIKPTSAYKSLTIDSMVLLKGNYLNVGELLFRHSDLVVKNYGSGALSTASMRGLGAHHTKVFWNGIPLNSGMNGTTDLSLISKSTFSDVYLNYGASGIINGAGGLGGAIDLRYVPNFENKMSIAASQGFESIGTSNTSFNYLTSSKKWNFQTGFNYQVSANEFEYINPEINLEEKVKMEDAGYDKINLTQSIFFKHRTKHRFGLRGFYTGSKRELPKLNVQLKGTENQEDESIIGSVEYQFTGKKVLILAQSSVSLSHILYENTAINLVSNSNEYKSWNQVRAKYFIGRKLKMESALIGDYTQGFNESYSLAKSQISMSMLHQAEWSVYKDVKVTAITKTLVVDEHFFPILPSLGIAIPLSKKMLMWRGNVAWQASVPSLNDQYWGTGGNVNLLPEEGFSVESELYGNLKLNQRNQFEYELTGYFSETHNWIAWAPNLNGVWMAENLDHVTAKGLESSFKCVFEGSKIRAATGARFSYNVSQDQNGYQLIYVPKNRFLYNVEVAFYNFLVLFDHQLSDRLYIQKGELAFLPSFSQSNISLGKEWKLKDMHRILTSVYCKNMFDEPFQSVAHRPMPMRYFGFTIKYSLS
ncbi:MAG: TonB-dependent receptor plug domain-containing protein [Flavobacteriales bacterium]|nr:TonB-dependent receptor plug domain-containing protein [Flavobacteriales bacterium]